MRFTIFMLSFIMIGFVAAAQSETFKGEHFIEVTGTAQTEIEPNEITVQVRLREFEENREKIALEKLDQDFLNALKNAGIDKKRLELADAGSKLDKLGRKDKDAFRQKTYQLKLTSATELEKFLEKLETVKVDLFSIIRLHHTDIEKIKLDLKVAALQAARSKADVMLKSIGASVGKPLMIREWDQDPIIQPMQTANVYMVQRSQAEGDMAGQDDGASFRKIRLKTQVTAQFEIK
jgi:hypothetical protein